MHPRLKQQVFSQISIAMEEVGYLTTPARLSQQAISTHGLRRSGIMFRKSFEALHRLIYLYEWHVPQSLKCVIGWSSKPIMPPPLSFGQRASLDGSEFGEKSFSIELFNLVDDAGEPLMTYRGESEGWYLIPPENVDYSKKDGLFERMLACQLVAIAKVNELDVDSDEASGLAFKMAERIASDLMTLAVPYLLRTVGR